MIVCRKTQKRIQELETQLEIAKQNEIMAYKNFEKLTKQYNKMRAEKEFYENLVNANLAFLLLIFHLNKHNKD